MVKAFISYSWDTSEHEHKVLDYTNRLRLKGFNATIDKMLNQDETAINFVKMMNKAMHEHSKVIVILSEGYKEKADNFTGGVGDEYQILLNDIKLNPVKYILASFEGRGKNITPLGLMGRDIIDLSDPEEENRLFGKLMDHKKYQFADVGPNMPDLETVPVHEFRAAIDLPPITIQVPSITATGNASFGGNQYTSIEMAVKFQFSNTSKKVVDGFAYSIKIVKHIDGEYYKHFVEDGFITINESVTTKMFPGQTVIAKQMKFEINRSNIQEIIDSVITISVFTELGANEQQFQFKDITRIRQAGNQHSDLIPIARDMFIS